MNLKELLFNFQERPLATLAPRLDCACCKDNMLSRKMMGMLETREASLPREGPRARMRLNDSFRRELNKLGVDDTAQ